MSNNLNLKEKIKSSFPPEILDFIARASETARSLNMRLYLVGGAVRDMLLGKQSLDIDLTVEGDGIALTKKLSSTAIEAEFHEQFGTAKLEIAKDISIDITTARKESYSRPGALPSVSPGSIRHDLFRRDFTVNAMAVSLNEDDFGAVIDLYGGLNDLDRKLIRVLHDKSFTDDATRIWRAIRYSERLGFEIEPNTLELLRRNIGYLDTITGDRIRYELECVFGEEYPEKSIERAAELGVLQKLSPHLKGNEDLSGQYEQTRDFYPNRRPPFALYASLLTCTLDNDEITRLISYLKLDKKTSHVLRDASVLRKKADDIGDAALSSARIFHLLSGYETLAIRALLIESEDATVKQHVELFESKLRNIKPLLTGDDLKRMGVPEGPKLKKILEKLLDATLNGETTNREDEERLVREWEK